MELNLKKLNIYSTNNMIRPEMRKGDIPKTREAYQSLIKIAMPSVCEMVLASFIGMADTMMVSGLGSAAIAAVGLTGQPRMLILSIFFAMNIGVTAVIARRKGEGRQEDANRTLKNMLALLMVVSVVFTALAMIFSEPLMRMSGAIEGETLADSMVYFNILISATPMCVITMAICASLRGIGNTKVTMYVNTASNVVNVIFNYFLIEGHFGFPRLGVAGAAWASVLGIAVSFVLSILAVTKKSGYIKLSLRSSWRPRREYVEPVLRVGGNAVLEQIALRIGFFIFARIVAELGTDNFATHQICMQFLNITFTIGDGLGVAATSLVGQNMGRGRPDVSMIYGIAAQRLALTVSLVLIAVIIALRVPLVMLFTDQSHIIELGAKIMIIVALFQPFQTTSVVISGCLRGAGDTKFVALVMMLCITLIRPAVALIAVYAFQFGLVGAWIASIIDMSIRMTAVYRRFASFKWANIQV